MRRMLLMILVSAFFAGCSDRQLNDAILTARIKTRMASDGRVSLTRIDVDSLNGDVTLSGEASSPEEKRAAEEVARGVEDVRSVNNRIIINPAAAGIGFPTGEDIRRRTETEVGNVRHGVRSEANDVFLRGEAKARLTAAGYGFVSVHVNQGVVTLNGETMNDKDRMVAQAIVERIDGVERVDNQLNLKPPPPPPPPAPNTPPCPPHPHERGR